MFAILQSNDCVLTFFNTFFLKINSLIYIYLFYHDRKLYMDKHNFIYLFVFKLSCFKSDLYWYFDHIKKLGWDNTEIIFNK